MPFCRRRTGRTKGEWICCDHWPLVDSRLRRYWRKQMRKLYRKWEAADSAYSFRNAELVAEADPRGIHIEDPVWALREAREKAAKRWRAAHATIWTRIKRQAITRAAGDLL